MPSRTTPNTSPAPTDQASIRSAACQASPARPAPSRRASRICPAIAIASRTSARNRNSSNAIWWAASEAGPMRAASAEHSVKAPSRAAVRTVMCQPVRSSGLIARGGGRAAVGGYGPHPPREREAHAELCDQRPDRRARESQVRAVDEHELQDHVRGVRDHEDPQRRAQVAQPAQASLARQREQLRGQAEGDDVQIQLGLPVHPGAAPEHASAAGRRPRARRASRPLPRRDRATAPGPRRPPPRPLRRPPAGGRPGAVVP